MMQGLLTMVLISACTIVLSLFFGTLVAMVRHFCTGKLTILSRLVGAYIEFFRCTPNILWILWIRFTMQGDPTVKAIFACTLFTTAVIAEIVRGGLNNVPKGQFEGAASQGFTFWQTIQEHHPGTALSGYHRHQGYFIPEGSRHCRVHEKQQYCHGFSAQSCTDHNPVCIHRTLLFCNLLLPVLRRAVLPETDSGDRVRNLGFCL